MTPADKICQDAYTNATKAHKRGQDIIGFASKTVDEALVNLLQAAATAQAAMDIGLPHGRVMMEAICKRLADMQRQCKIALEG